MESISRERKKILNRLKRIEGQARGIHKMVDHSESLDQTLIQVRAIKSAIVSLENSLYSLSLSKLNYMIEEGIDKQLVVDEMQHLSDILSKRI